MGIFGEEGRSKLYNIEVFSISNWRVKIIGGFWIDIFFKIRIIRSWFR